jgi:hypothetical protein
MLVPDQGAGRVTDALARQYEPEKHVQFLPAAAGPPGAEQLVESPDKLDGARPDGEVGAGPEHAGRERVKARGLPVCIQVIAARLEFLTPRDPLLEVPLGCGIQPASDDRAGHARRARVRGKGARDGRRPGRADQHVIVGVGHYVVTSPGQGTVAGRGQARPRFTCVPDTRVVPGERGHELASCLPGRRVVDDQDLERLIGGPAEGFQAITQLIDAVSRADRDGYPRAGAGGKVTRAGHRRRPGRSARLGGQLVSLGVPADRAGQRRLRRDPDPCRKGVRWRDANPDEPQRRPVGADQNASLRLPGIQRSADPGGGPAVVKVQHPHPGRGHHALPRGGSLGGSS